MASLKHPDVHLGPHRREEGEGEISALDSCSLNLPRLWDGEGHFERVEPVLCDQISKQSLRLSQ